MGGGLALLLAARQGRRVAGLSLVNPSVHSADPAMRALPVLRHVVPSLAAHRRTTSPCRTSPRAAYERTPLHAAWSLTKLWKEIQRELPRVDQPLLIFRSQTDHVVGPSSLAMITERIRSTGAGGGPSGAQLPRCDHGLRCRPDLQRHQRVLHPAGRGSEVGHDERTARWRSRPRRVPCRWRPSRRPRGRRPCLRRARSELPPDRRPTRPAPPADSSARATAPGAAGPVVRAEPRSADRSAAHRSATIGPTTIRSAARWSTGWADDHPLFVGPTGPQPAMPSRIPTSATCPSRSRRWTGPDCPILLAWLGIAYAAVVVLLAAFGVRLPPWTGWLAVGTFMIGFGVLVFHLPAIPPTRRRRRGVVA